MNPYWCVGPAVCGCLLLYLHGLKPVLSFTLSEKHMSYAYTHLMHKTITNNINCMHLYYELIRVLLLITGLYSYGTPVEVTRLILMQILYLFRFLVCCTELILITDLCSFETPVVVTELILMQNLYLYRLMLIEIYTYSIQILYL